MDTYHDSRLETLNGIDADGRMVVVSPASVLAVMPDPENPGRTRLHVADGIVLVEGEYEGWMDRLAAGWTGACSA